MPPEVVFKIDQTKSMRDQDVPGHNRWHPDIPAVASVKPGQDFRVECREWTDGQIGNNDSAADVRDAKLNVAHMLSGPIEIEGAEPGDLLVVDILDIGPIQTETTGPAPGQGWGYTGIFAKHNGGGFLTDHFPDAYKAIWDFHGIYATSRHIPGVRFAGITHPGLFGTAPSHELLAEWNRRERALIEKDPNRVPPLALPPEPDGVLAGKLTGPELERIGREGARTVPARENGGNHDIKNFTRGARVYYPVFVPGAKLSGGDLHFSQGDGEITFCGAIEMGGFIDFGVDLIKDGMNKYGITTNPVFIPGPVEPRYSTFLSFIGFSVDEHSGENLYIDATVAYRRACLNAIEYLKKFGYSGEQAYLLLGAAPIEGRISGVVDIPNACCSLYLPVEIFEFDIRPNAQGPTPADRGSAART
ncbi:formamidase [Sphaerobacter thermophilus]|jgi:formamidase|uniref:formamidase n=1 Tax=Sphaerobacter thermophilus TaxID=2057 RepID=UPI00396DA824